MTAKRAAAAVAFFGVLAATIVLSKRGDLDILLRVGKKAAEKVQSGLPDARKATGPLAAFRAGDALPVEERVRVRIQTDKQMAGAEVTVVSTSTAGEVRLRGVVQTGNQRQRAIELAEGTAGVDKVLEELAVPER
jgi:osmotically-inducible protein OsmY